MCWLKNRICSLRTERHMKKIPDAQVNTPNIHTRKSLLWLWLCVCVYARVRAPVCVFVCMQTVGGAGTGDSVLRGMRHCIKLWTSVPHRNHKVGAEEIKRITALSLPLSPSPSLLSPPHTNIHAHYMHNDLPHHLSFPPTFIPTSFSVYFTASCIIINMYLFPHLLMISAIFVCSYLYNRYRYSDAIIKQWISEGTDISFFLLLQINRKRILHYLVVKTSVIEQTIDSSWWSKLQDSTFD